uniref:Glycerophosphoryl diester phosphodiesterase membrane domain-containing protein n=1 Tax=Amphora coffeiformis TaxID=265554 RepID=A0A7S3PAM9_9STRA
MMDFFQKLSLEETFRRVGLVFSRKWAVFLSITVLAYLLFFAASVMTIFIMAPFIDYQSGNGYSDPHTVVAALLDNAIYYAVMCIADGAIVRAVAEMYVGQVPTVDGTLQLGLSKLYQLFCNAVIIGAAVAFPAILVLLFLVWISGGAQVVVIMFNFFFLIVAIGVVVVTYHTYPVIMVEEKGPIDSIQRSYDLSQGHRVYIFTCIMLFFLGKFILHTICNVIGAHAGGAVTALMVLLKLIISVIFATLGSILQAVVYISVRSDKEGLTHQVMVTELFGPTDEEGNTSYVAANTADETPAAGGAPATVPASSPSTDGVTEGSVV